MIKPFYQGKLDAFCAVYAVLNGLRLTHSIRSKKGVEILNNTLIDLSADPEKFRKFLTQETDYMDIVDHILSEQQKQMPLEVLSPLSEKTSHSEFWDACHSWLGGAKGGKAIIFRFLRYLKPDKPPLNRHWTTTGSMDRNAMHLFDCSHEAEAILNIKKDSFVVSADEVNEKQLMYIQPESVRFLRLPF